jgi:hypothetical protein
MELIQIVFAGEKGGGWNQKVIAGDGLNGKVILQIKQIKRRRKRYEE